MKVKVMNNEVVERTEEAVNATSGKGWVIAGILAGAAVVAGVVYKVVKTVIAKKAEKLIEATCNEVENEDFEEETE